MRTNTGYFRFILSILFVGFLGLFFWGYHNTLSANNNTPDTKNSELQSEHPFLLEKSTLIADFNRLDKLTPLDLSYNQDVQSHLDRFLASRRADIADYLGKSTYYFPQIEEILDRHDLPLELKYLVIIESGLNPRAKSKSGAMGLWQFMYNTGKLFDLQITSYVDERCDPIKSTEAACQYLSYLYQTFNDWNLTLAAYNGGPGEVRKAIERSGGITDYWELRPYLSKQAAEYVPAFIAMNYVFSFYQKLNIEPLAYKFVFNEIDSLHIGYSLSFIQISEVINLSEDDLNLLNPVYRKNYIPDTRKENVLFLPKNRIKPFLLYENDIKAQTIEELNYLELVQQAGEIGDKQKVIHEVKPGEYYHMIALKYRCTIENIKAWNQIADTPLYEGQKLTLWITQ